MLMHANAHGGCTDTVRESALKVAWEEKIPCRTGESNLPQRRAGAILYQLSYIPMQSLLEELDIRSIVNSQPIVKVTSGLSTIHQITSKIWFSVHNAWFGVHNAWFIVHNAWFIVHNAWFLVHNACFSVHEAWFNAHNARFGVHSARHFKLAENWREKESLNEGERRKLEEKKSRFFGSRRSLQNYFLIHSKLSWDLQLFSSYSIIKQDYARSASVCKELETGMPVLLYGIDRRNPSSCMIVSHGPSQRSCKQESKPWK